MYRPYLPLKLQFPQDQLGHRKLYGTLSHVFQSGVLSKPSFSLKKRVSWKMTFSFGLGEESTLVLSQWHLLVHFWSLMCSPPHKPCCFAFMATDCSPRLLSQKWKEISGVPSNFFKRSVVLLLAAKRGAKVWENDYSHKKKSNTNEGQSMYTY